MKPCNGTPQYQSTLRRPATQLPASRFILFFLVDRTAAAEKTTQICNLIFNI